MGRRVALVHWAFPPTTGGVESHLADLARLLAARGCEVTVITGEPAPSGDPAYETLSSPVLNLELVGSARSEGVLRELGALLRDCHPEVVHGHNLHHFHPAPALALHRLRDELGFTLHHTFHETWPDVLHDAPVYRDWDRNWSVSAHVQSECEARLGFRPELLHLPVDEARFRSTRTPLQGDAKPVLLHPARLLPWKGVHVSIRMLAELRERGVEATLIVTDTQRIADWDDELTGYRARIHADVETLGVQDLVRFAAASYDEMPALYDLADVVVYPTVGEEPYGLVPLEAMSCARPVVASRSGGILETVIDGETGFIVEREDSVALADRVWRLLEDRGLAVEMGRRGRARVEERFAVSPFMDALLAGYEGGVLL